MTDLFLADCPARLAVELIADKWTVVVLAGLSRGPVRHGDLADRIGGISRKVLTQTLRRLEAHGLVSRRVYAEAPPRVEYELTPLGATLTEPIQVLSEWARQNGEAVLDALDAGSISGARRAAAAHDALDAGPASR
ncbi:winged helix-turn-helix transcriptional regulator [Symbioplanes lichenis]|uniref:winged helix-turn-helix transcriptional regulator n=1 Tax=Symbioplanes lichenis TaxID=1629072 RepID=UPI002739886A|nr:helix-turn-helix domain-containing protein [Actinoplanes lichenis]